MSCPKENKGWVGICPKGGFPQTSNVCIDVSGWVCQGLCVGVGGTLEKRALKSYLFGFLLLTLFKMGGLALRSSFPLFVITKG